MHLGGVAWTLGVLAALFGAGMMAPALVALADGGGLAWRFVEAGLIACLAGLALMRAGGGAPAQLGHRDGFLIVALAWVLLSALGALPFLTAGVIASPVDALFESASGLTTTGATVLTGLDHLPRAILFWRSMQEWLGGMGLIVLAVAVMPLLGIGGMQLFKAETPGPVKDKLTARVTETAKVLWYLYVAMTAVCALAYRLGGMGLFDAVNHAMCTVAIGGFSTHDASFGWFAGTHLRLIAALFMFLAGINFTLHFAALSGGFSPRSLFIYLRDDEFRAYARWCGALLLLMLMVVVGAGAGSWDEVVFNTISIATTTGFAVSDYATWPAGTMMLFVMAMFIGACAGSTGGGMKVVRVLLLFRQGAREIRRLIHPHAVSPVKVGDQAVDASVTQTVWGFAVLFVAGFVLIATLVAFSGVDPVTAASAAAACITNTGPGFGEVGPASTYAGLPAAAKGILVFGMILGRLEVFTFLVLLTPGFWRK